jgi:uncharacterized protein
VRRPCRGHTWRAYHTGVRALTPLVVSCRVFSPGCDPYSRDSTGNAIEEQIVEGEDFDLLHIFVDADACPVKQEVYRVARRYQLDVTLVANSWMRVPNEEWIALEVVGEGFDAADDWIVSHVEPDDIVVTADIPLASRCVAEGARVVGPTGRPFTEENIGQAVATRDLLSGLREAGEITGGPAPLKKRDRSRFLQQFDDVIQSIRRKRPFPSS